VSVIPGKRQLRVDWDLADPSGRPIDEVWATRDDIERRVREQRMRTASTDLLDDAGYGPFLGSRWPRDRAASVGPSTCRVVATT
jgi:hypothetical protein